jgi:hypothetical protein
MQNGCQPVRRKDQMPLRRANQHANGHRNAARIRRPDYRLNLLETFLKKFQARLVECETAEATAATENSSVEKSVAKTGWIPMR